MSLAQRISGWRSTIDRLGWRGALAWRSARRGAADGVARLHCKPLRQPLHARRAGSDLDVFRQIFFEEQYAPALAVRNPKLIIDAGANVGYVTRYFQHFFPAADIVAVEPDPSNFDMLIRNTRDISPRIKLIRAAVWSHVTHLRLLTEDYRDGREWARRVGPADPAAQGGEVIAVDIPTLIGNGGHPRISLLKMDIEGAEQEVFSRGADAWLDLVDHIIIELHGRAATDAFTRAVESRFEIERGPHVWFCRRASTAAEKSISA